MWLNLVILGVMRVVVCMSSGLLVGCSMCVCDSVLELLLVFSVWVLKWLIRVLISGWGSVFVVCSSGIGNRLMILFVMV